MPERRPGERHRLLLVSPLPPPTGGIPTWTLGVLDSSLRESFEIRVLDTSPSEKVVVHQASRFGVGRALDALRILSRLFWQLLRFRPDVVHVNTPYFWAFLRDGPAIWLARLFGARTVLHFRGGDFPDFVRGASAPVRRAIVATLRRSSRLLALTTETQEFLAAILEPGRTRLVPNFVSLEDIGELPDRRARVGRPPQVLFVGWILEAKGVGELLEAAREFPEVPFTLIGAQQPSFVETIQGEIEAAREHVRILAPRPREEMIQLYTEADIFVLPTYREGFPNVVLEAMAAGLPVIATPVGAIPSAVRDGQEGLLVPPRDSAALAEALRSLIEDPERRLAMGERARQRVEQEFSREVVVRRLDSIYRELLA